MVNNVSCTASGSQSVNLSLTGDRGVSGVTQAVHGTYLIGLNGTAGQVHATILDELPGIDPFDGGRVTAGQSATFTASGNGLDPGGGAEPGEIGLDIYDPNGVPVYWGYIDSWGSLWHAIPRHIPGY